MKTNEHEFDGRSFPVFRVDSCQFVVALSKLFLVTLHLGG